MILTIPEDIHHNIQNFITTCPQQTYGIFFGRSFLDNDKEKQNKQIWATTLNFLVKDSNETKSSGEKYIKSILLRHIDINLIPVGIWIAQSDGARINFDLINNIKNIYKHKNKMGSTRKKVDQLPLFCIDINPECIQYSLIDKNYQLTQEIDLDIIHFKSDIYSRLTGLFDIDHLQKKSVVIIGLGTGGSLAAVELAKCGIGNLILIDYDHLETHNITRHVCNITDIGRLKTHAVRDLIKLKNPFINVTTYEFDILKNKDQLKKIFRGKDLVFAATDTHTSKLFINKICIDENIPSIYAGAYEMAHGGEIFRVIPKVTPCYNCIKGELLKNFQESIQKKPLLDYSNIDDPTQLKAEPGLSIDVGFITFIATKMAILTLLKDTNHKFYEIPYDIIFWGNKPIPEYNIIEPFSSNYATFQRSSQCEVCGYHNEDSDPIKNKKNRDDISKIIRESNDITGDLKKLFRDQL
jgi:tRNA A37 threonylcarbamoyladenosine dehydratase